MAEVISAEDVPRLLTLVAPGFFAMTAYRWVSPGKDRGELPTLMTSVALSLPFVALANAIAHRVAITADPTELGFVVLLLALATVTGYAAARVRSASAVRKILLKIGHHSDPAASVLTRTVMEMNDKKGQVTIRFKDGQSPLAGTPRFATEDPETGEQQIYLDHHRWWNDDKGAWREKQDRGGVLVRLDEVRSIEINRNPK